MTTSLWQGSDVLFDDGGGSLVDALDTVLQRGAAIDGDLVLSVAGVDLVWLGLRAVLAGIEHAPEGARLDRPEIASAPPTRRSDRSQVLPSRAQDRKGGAPRRGGGRVDIPEGNVEDGLVRLVLSVVELLRELMERQALRRVDAGGLGAEDVERLGRTLCRLQERMEALKGHFGLDGEDLAVDLGPVRALT